MDMRDWHAFNQTNDEMNQRDIRWMGTELGQDGWWWGWGSTNWFWFGVGSQYIRGVPNIQSVTDVSIVSCAETWCWSCLTPSILGRYCWNIPVLSNIDAAKTTIWNDWTRIGSKGVQGEYRNHCRDSTHRGTIRTNFGQGTKSSFTCCAQWPNMQNGCSMW